jgi:uncharacterized membrane protein YoaK (UPF0700 family)
LVPASKLAVGLTFTACAGCIDAVGFIELGGYFLSFMSGNSTQLGTGLASLGAMGGRSPLLPFVLIGCFFLGGVAGSLVALTRPRHGASLVLLMILGAVCAAMGFTAAHLQIGVALLPLPFAAGAQNAMLPQSGAARLGTTYVTGTLYAGANDLAKALLKQAPAWRWAQHVMVWMALCAGALLGAIGDATWGIGTLAVPAAVYAFFLYRFLVEPA